MISAKFKPLKHNPNHPFKVGIRTILAQHFSLDIVKNFVLEFEAEKYNPAHKLGKGIQKQIEDQNFICEVSYVNPSGIQIYITDVYSWWSKAQCEAALLRFITDKVRTGMIGKDWIDEGGKISEDVRTGKYETPDSEITKYMKPRKKGGK